MVVLMVIMLMYTFMGLYLTCYAYKMLGKDELTTVWLKYTIFMLILTTIVGILYLYGINRGLWNVL